MGAKEDKDKKDREDWANHVYHTSREVLSPSKYLATHMSLTGEVSIEATFDSGAFLDVYVGVVGDLMDDTQLHDIAAEAEVTAHDNRETELEAQRQRKDEAREERSNKSRQ